MNPQSIFGHPAVRWISVLLAGLLLTVAASWSLFQYNQSALQAQTSKLASEVETLIRQRFAVYEYGLRGVRGVVIGTGVDSVTRERLAAYSQSREVGREFPGALGFGFIRRVPLAQEAQFLARARADGAPNFSIRALTPHTADRFVIQYIFPVAGNEQAIGLDIGSEFNRRQAALAAAREDQPQLTRPITLVQADGKVRQGLLILLPVYRADMATSTAQAREEAVVGWSYAPLVIDAVLHGLDSLTSQVSLRITQEGDTQPFYRTATDTPPATLPGAVQRSIFVMGQHWILDVAPRTAMRDTLNLWSHWSAIWFGLLLTLAGLFASNRWLARAEAEALLQDNSDTRDRRFSAFLHSSLMGRFGLPVLVSMLMLTALGSWHIIQNQLEAVQARTLATTQAALERTGLLESSYRRDALFLAATPPVNALKNFHDKASNAQGDSSEQVWKERLSNIFEAYMQATPDVVTVQLLEVKTGLTEVVRNQRAGDRLVSSTRGSPIAEFNAAYLSEPLKLAAGKVFVSDIVLNRENGVIERPPRPVWRFATPVYSADGRPYGLVLLSVRADTLLQDIAAQAPLGGSMYVTNEGFDFLHHPDSNRTFGFERGQPYRWQDEFTPASALPGLGPTGLSGWRSLAQGAVWASEREYRPADRAEGASLRIFTSTQQAGVYQAMAQQIVLLLGAVLIVGLAAFVVLYRAWYLQLQGVRDATFRQLDRERKIQIGLFENLIDSAPDATIIVNEAGTIEMVNAEAERLFGYPRAQLLGQPVHTLLPARLAQAHLSHLSGYMKNPLARSMGAGRELLACRADGSEFPVEISLGPVQMPDRLLVAAAIRDVSERLAVEERLRQVSLKAQEATHAKSAFLANTSHEIRTPLNAIIGLSYLLADDTLTEAQLKLVEKIQFSGRALLGIVNDVLDLSKIEANEMTVEEAPVSLRDMLEELSAVFSTQAEAKNLQFHLKLDDRLPNWVKTDELRLRQILTNLLGNAVKFTSVGDIRLDAQVLPAEAAQAADCVRVRFTVHDSGIGISTDALSRLFKPFVQADASTSRSFGGTGLGLSIVRRLTDLLGGDVGVESNESVGSRFWLELPLRKLAEAEVSEHDAKSSSLLLLIADDDPVDAKHLEKSARALGWRTQVVTSGEGLVQAFVARQASGLAAPDALVVDWQMPHMDGLQALGELVKQVGHNKLPAVLMISAHEQAAIVSADRGHLADRILQKPVDASELFNAVNDVVTGHTGNPSRVLRSTRTESVKARWLPGVRVLVVDDSHLNLEVVAQILKRNGAVVSTLDNGAAALERLRATHDAYDVVLMDVQMPQMDGLETTQRLRQDPRLATLPIIALTAGALVEERRRALEVGMNDFLTKPVDPSELINRLRIAVEKYHGKSVAVEALEKAEPVHDSDWPHIAGLNAVRARRLLAGDVQLLLTTLSRLLEEHANLANPPDAEIDQPGASAKRLQIASQVHKLRSAAGMVGADRVQDLAALAETTLRSTAGQPAHAILAQLAAAMVALREASLQVLHAWRKGLDAQQAGTRPGTDVRRLGQPELEQFLELLSGNELTALDWMETHEAALRVTLSEVDFDQLQVCLGRLDFKKAHAVLKEYIKEEGRP